MPAVKLICTTALKTSIEDLQVQFEREAGCTLGTTYGASAQLTKRLVEGEPADVVVLTRPGIDEMVQAGKVVSGSDLAIASSDTMVGVKQGTPKPDISTVEKFKQAMLAAKSIAYSGPGSGASGAHVAKVFEELGIPRQDRARPRWPGWIDRQLSGARRSRDRHAAGRRTDDGAGCRDRRTPAPGHRPHHTVRNRRSYCCARERRQGARAVPAHSRLARRDEGERADASGLTPVQRSPSLPRKGEGSERRAQRDARRVGLARSDMEKSPHPAHASREAPSPSGEGWRKLHGRYFGVIGPNAPFFESLSHFSISALRCAASRSGVPPMKR